MSYVLYRQTKSSLAEFFNAVEIIGVFDTLEDAKAETGFGESERWQKFRTVMRDYDGKPPLHVFDTRNGDFYIIDTMVVEVE